MSVNHINKDTIVQYCSTKNPEEDKNFVQCLLALYDIEPYTLRNIEPRKNPNSITLPSIYMLEQCWRETDMTEFYRQYDEFVINQRSSFFFQSNLINMARTLLCYYTGCLDRYYREGDHSVFNKNKLNNSFRDAIRKGFKDNKDALVRILCKAYDSFHYKDVLAMYRAYIEFYGEHVSPYIRSSFIRPEYPKLVKSKVNGYYTQESHLESIRKLFDEFNSVQGIYLYLSFNTGADWRYARFLGTKMIVSNLSYKCTHDTLCNTLEVIMHDFTAHLVRQRMIEIDDVYFKNLIQRIQDTCSDKDYKSYLHLLHQAGHEERLITFGKTEIQNYCKVMIERNMRGIILRKAQLKGVEELTDEELTDEDKLLKRKLEELEKKNEFYETFLEFLEPTNSASKGGSRRKKHIKRRKYRTYKKYRS